MHYFIFCQRQMYFTVTHGNPLTTPIEFRQNIPQSEAYRLRKCFWWLALARKKIKDLLWIQEDQFSTFWDSSSANCWRTS